MTRLLPTSVALIACLLCCAVTRLATALLQEVDRIEEYKKRGYQWPLNGTIPNTTGWQRLQFRRLAQVERIERDKKKYDGWLHIVTTSIVAPNFTQNGWGLTRAPGPLVEELKTSLHNGLANDPDVEGEIEPIETEELPYFIPQQALNRKVLKELKPMHEEWSGVPLVGSIAYGLRAYRNNSVLFMHADKPSTHIISSILHVDHSEDSEPWPIFIEDLQGNTNEVVLESGDMLFYESSKCIHGRPRPFRGSWYSSIFVHYRPEKWDTGAMGLEPHYAIPPHWTDVKPDEPGLEKLVMAGTSMYEPECPDRWCGTKDTVKWFGPAKEGVVMTTGYTGDNEVVESNEL